MSKIKKFFFILTIPVLSFLLFELLFRLTRNEEPVIKELGQDSLIHQAMGVVLNENMNKYLGMKPHPFFGTTLRPGGSINNHGFKSEFDFPLKKEKGKTYVGVFGGSVAHNLANWLNSDYAKTSVQFKKILNVKDAPIFINFSFPGGKQPQQLFISQFYSESLDYAINFDAYNECLPFPDPVEFPYYYTTNFLPLEFDAEILLRLKATKSFGWYINHSVLKHSSVARRLYKILRNSLDTLVSKKFELFKAKITEEKTASSKAIYLASLWEKYTSLQSSSLKNNGVRFFSFIQPNQHFRDSKPLSKVEKDKFISKNFKKFIQPCYEEISQAIERLKSKKVDIYDLRFAFSKTKETTYTDKFTHINDFGRMILFKKMLKHMATSEH